jgi:hypothetical protein
MSDPHPTGAASGPPADNGKLAWLGAAMNDTPSAAVAATAALYATFYNELVTRGVPGDVAGYLTREFMCATLAGQPRGGCS